jgi:hypothetical protein
MADIHDIKPALAMGADLTWLYWVAGALALLALVYLGWRLWLRRKKVPPAAPAPSPIAPDAEAYQALDALAADDATNPKQFYFRLSAIIRRYVERRYAIPAAEMTTEELIPRVDRLPLAPDLAQPFKALCRAADPIKFAGAAAPPDRIPRDLSFARDFVRRTTSGEKSTAENEDTTETARQRLKRIDHVATE